MLILRLRFAFVCSFLLLLTSPALCGKLGSVRGKARDPKPASKQPVSKSSSSANDKDERRTAAKESASTKPAPSRKPANRPERRKQSKTASVRRSTSSNSPSISFSSRSTNSNSTTRVAGKGKLESVRERTRRPPTASPPRPTGPRPDRNPVRPRPPRPLPPRHRPPRRSPAPGFGFYSTFGPNPCPPAAFVTEHHYYPAEPLLVEQPLLTSPVLSPVMPSTIDAHGPPPIPTYPLNEPLVVEDHAAPIEHIVVDNTLHWSPNPYQVRFEIDYAGDEADVSRMGFGLLANATKGLGVDTGVRLFREKDTDFRDHLWLGDFNVTFELHASQHMRTRAGVGVNFLADGYGEDAGLNLTAGADIFLGPLTFTGEADLGTIGDADLFHGRVSAAFRCSEQMESFIGYDYIDLGGVEFSGLLAGVRFRY